MILPFRIVPTPHLRERQAYETVHLREDNEYDTTCTMCGERAAVWTDSRYQWNDHPSRCSKGKQDENPDQVPSS